MGHDQRRAIQILDNVGSREGLAGTGHAEQRLVTVSHPDRASKLLDRLSLIPLGLVVGSQVKRHLEKDEGEVLKAKT
jgi:hypothetical protein